MILLIVLTKTNYTISVFLVGEYSVHNNEHNIVESIGIHARIALLYVQEV